MGKRHGRERGERECQERKGRKRWKKGKMDRNGRGNKERKRKQEIKRITGNEKVEEGKKINGRE